MHPGTESARRQTLSFQIFGMLSSSSSYRIYLFFPPTGTCQAMREIPLSTERRTNSSL